MATKSNNNNNGRLRSRQRTASDDGSTSPSPPTITKCNMKQQYCLEDLEIKNTLGTGTFGRVVLVRHKPSLEYFALKMLPITEVVRLKQVEHVKNEKEILLAVKHPFIVKLLWTDHNDRFLYMLLEYICGGELFTYLRNAGHFTSASGLFYTCEIILALDYLHSLSIVYRDLKPENLLLDREGHLKITDFGFAKKLEDRTWTLCGTPEYLAPEIIQSKGHNKAVDWWALGILIYEMLVGYPPFFDDNPFGIYEKILAGKIDWPKHIDPVARDLIKKLLVQDRTKRLGNMKNGTDDVKNHRWFRGITWEDVHKRKLEVPFVPKVSHEGDTQNFDGYAEIDYKMIMAAPEKDRDLFVDF
jgi:protein kinase X